MISSYNSLLPVAESDCTKLAKFIGRQARLSIFIGRQARLSIYRTVFRKRINAGKYKLKY